MNILSNYNSFLNELQEDLKHDLVTAFDEVWIVRLNDTKITKYNPVIKYYYKESNIAREYKSMAQKVRIDELMFELKAKTLELNQNHPKNDIFFS